VMATPNAAYQRRISEPYRTSRSLEEKRR
jgi:hypothetical protein